MKDRRKVRTHERDQRYPLSDMIAVAMTPPVDAYKGAVQA
jgi:hypothetical protein